MRFGSLRSSHSHSPASPLVHYGTGITYTFVQQLIWARAQVFNHNSEELTELQFLQYPPFNFLNRIVDMLQLQLAGDSSRLHLAVPGAVPPRAVALGDSVEEHEELRCRGARAREPMGVGCGGAGQVESGAAEG